MWADMLLDPSMSPLRFVKDMLRIFSFPERMFCRLTLCPAKEAAVAKVLSHPATSQANGPVAAVKSHQSACRVPVRMIPTYGLRNADEYERSE